MQEASSDIAAGDRSSSGDAPGQSAAGGAGSPEAPEAGLTRYRCTACGNLTRFDVLTTRRTRAFHHYSLGGELVVEDVEVLEESVEEVSCRWCGHGNAIETVDD